MDYFVSTYRKDFKWPMVKITPPQKQIEQTCTMKELGLQDAEPCAKDIGKTKSLKTEVSEGIDPLPKGGSKYLEKLFQKYPYLRTVMKFTNPDEMAKKILSEKYKTTYQIEYNKEEFHPANNFTEIMDVLDTAEKIKHEDKKEIKVCTKNGGSKKILECKCAQGLSFVPCKCSKDAPVRRIAWKPAPISKIPQASREKKPKKDEDERALQAAGEGNKKIKPYSSEYNDTISRVGGIIIKKKLLSRTEGDGATGKQNKRTPTKGREQWDNHEIY